MARLILQGAVLKSGLYGESLHLAVNRDRGTISGYYASSGGFMSGNGWRCYFYFSGPLNDYTANIVASSIYLKKYEVTTFTKGTIKPFHDDGVVLKLNEEISGCAQGQDFFEETPSPIILNNRDDPLERRYTDIEYRIVKKKRSYFFKSRVAPNHMKSYLVCGDVVLITETDPVTRRGKSRFAGTEHVTEGWLSLDDFAPIGERLKCEN